MKTKLSININKVALIRNSRKGNFPDIYKFARDCEDFGADGITVHPRPDERHIRYSDIPILKEQNKTEFNIEGNPNRKFLDMVIKNKPDQCTLVPDSPDALTSDAGWDTIQYASFLKEVVDELKSNGIRVSIFVDPIPEMVLGAAKVGADRIEFYTGEYAKAHALGKGGHELEKHVLAGKEANVVGLGINAGHDLNLKNLKDYKIGMPNLMEVSIGHAVVVDALYYGVQNTILMYDRMLNF